MNHSHTISMPREILQFNLFKIKFTIFFTSSDFCFLLLINWAKILLAEVCKYFLNDKMLIFDLEKFLAVFKGF